MMHRYKITLSYDGTDYAGWQVQPRKRTVQAVTQQALKDLSQENVTLIGSGRTDSGVHAFGQVAHFSLTSIIPPNQLLTALNTLLPTSIRARALKIAPPSFHARFSARKKTYIYSIDCSPISDPLKQRYLTPIRAPLNFQLFEQALNCFVGTKDFTSFANENHKGAAARQPIKTIYSIQLTQADTISMIAVEGNGFLYKMVRNLISTALQVGLGKLPLSAIDSLFAAKDRRLAPPPAPSKGLCLASVSYC